LVRAMCEVPKPPGGGWGALAMPGPGPIKRPIPIVSSELAYPLVTVPNLPGQESADAARLDARGWGVSRKGQVVS